MATNTYTVTINSQQIKIYHNDVSNDNYFQPRNETLMLEVNGSPLAYGSSEYNREIVRFKLPDFRNVNVKVWHETFRPNIVSPNEHLAVARYKSNPYIIREINEKTFKKDYLTLKEDF